MTAHTNRYQWDSDDDFEFLLEDEDDYEPNRHRSPRRPARGHRPNGGSEQRASRRRRSRDDFDKDDLDSDISEALERKARERRKADISEPFKCRNCRAFIGMPPTGGQQRNHCPMCLYSLHVDGRTPGDRASDCRSLMEPIGVFYRPNMEQVLVHRCLGCGFVRYNRIAADDNPILLAELPVMDPPTQDLQESTR